MAAFQRVGGNRVSLLPDLTASKISVITAGALAFTQGQFNFDLFIIALASSILLQVGTNIINEIYDVRNGIDSITSPRVSHALLKGRVKEREAFSLAITTFILATIFGINLIAVCCWQVAALGVLGLIGGFGYTALPMQYKYKALGFPLVFTLMGPLMVGGAYYIVTSGWAWNRSSPVSLLDYW